MRKNSHLAKWPSFAKNKCLGNISHGKFGGRRREGREWQVFLKVFHLPPCRVSILIKHWITVTLNKYFDQHNCGLGWNRGVRENFFSWCFRFYCSVFALSPLVCSCSDDNFLGFSVGLFSRRILVGSGFNETLRETAKFTGTSTINRKEFWPDCKILRNFWACLGNVFSYFFCTFIL